MSGKYRPLFHFEVRHAICWTGLARLTQPRERYADLNEAARAADAARNRIPAGGLDWSIVGS